MPEISGDAAILIGISKQALDRIDEEHWDTYHPNCIVSILFSVFYIEGSLTELITIIGRESDIESFVFPKGKRADLDPNLYQKMIWFYNEYFAKPKSKITLNSEFFDKDNYSHNKKRLNSVFPGFDKLRKFRNEISHGIINRELLNRNHVEELRKQAKDIIRKVINKLNQEGYSIESKENYYETILDLDFSEPVFPSGLLRFSYPYSSSDAYIGDIPTLRTDHNNE